MALLTAQLGLIQRHLGAEQCIWNGPPPPQRTPPPPSPQEVSLQAEVDRLRMLAGLLQEKLDLKLAEEARLLALISGEGSR